MSAAIFAPAPDFRYVGLEPIPVKRVGAAATAFGLGAGVTLAMSGFDGKQALLAGALASLASGFALRGVGQEKPASGVRMGIVPWGVLVETDDGPRVLRWAAVRHVSADRTRHTTRVTLETEHEKFVGETVGQVPLERLVDHLDAYTAEQNAPLSLDLDGERPADSLEPQSESLLDAALAWIDSSLGHTRLSLPPSGYRSASAHAATRETLDVLREVLGDRTPKAADPRAFAAVVAGELGARELSSELVSLTQSPHPLVAAFAKQAARKLGVPRARTGTLDEVAPFLWERDLSELQSW